LLATRPTPKLADHPSSAVRDYLFNLFAATLLIGGSSSLRNLRTRHAVVTGTHYMASSGRCTVYIQQLVFAVLFTCLYVGRPTDRQLKSTTIGGQLKCDGTRAETRFCLSAKRTSPFKLGEGGRRFSRLLAAEVCASAVIMLDTPCSEVV